MKSAIAKAIITILATVVLTEGCYAQTSGGGRKQHQQKIDRPAARAPKADEKAYNAALKNLPG
jgi:hypothetical protein